MQYQFGLRTARNDHVPAGISHIRGDVRRVALSGVSVLGINGLIRADRDLATCRNGGHASRIGVAVAVAIDFKVSTAAIAYPDAAIVVAPGRAFTADVVTQLALHVYTTARVGCAVLAVVIAIVV